MNADTPPIKLYTALLAAMRDFGAVKKDRQNPAFRSSYATLHSILEAVEGPLNDHGLILVQRLQPTGEGLLLPMLVTELIHAESGQSISSTVLVASKDPNDPQKVGGAITYFRRYSLLTLLNLTPEEDDDGNAASQPIQRQQNGQRPNGQQRYDHARQHGKDPATNDAPMWNDIEEAMEDDFRRYAQRAAGIPSSPQTNGSAPTRAAQPPIQTQPPYVPQKATAAPTAALAPDDPLAEVVAKLRAMETEGKHWDTIRQYADEQWELANDYGKGIINATAKAIKVRRTSKPAALPPASIAG